MHTLERLDQRREHLFGQHRGLVDDDRMRAGLGRLVRKAIAAGRAVIAVRAQELGDGVALEL